MSVKVIYNSLRTQTVSDTSSALTLNQLSTGSVLTLQRNSTTLWEADKNMKVTHSGEYALTGVMNVSAVGSPAGLAIVVTGTAGATTYGYKISATVGGYETEVSSEVTDATGNATLSATNYNALSWTKKAGATGYKVYRTTGGATQGLISTITDRDTNTLNDTGLAGDSATGPTVDRTGTIALADNTYLALGSDDDGVIFHTSAGIAANTARAGVLVGTPVTPATAANSIIVSNITASGDILFAVNTGGNSKGYILIDGSAENLIFLGGGIQTVVINSTIVQVQDGIVFALGNSSDIAMVHRTAILAANTALTNVLVGTPVTPAIAADSLILSNITADGDILIATQTGGNSKAALWVDTSAGETRLYGAGTIGLIIDSTKVTLSGGQLVFPGTQAASADVNTLDDYEEGTWTPSLQFGGATTGITYGTQSGQYTKIGNMVYLTGRITLTSNGTATGAATLTGIPFAAGSPAPATLWINVVTYANIPIAELTASTINFREVTEAGTLTNLDDTNFPDTSDVIFSVIYRV